MAEAPGVEIGAEVVLVIGGFMGDEARVAATADRQVIADRDGARLAGCGRADGLRASTAGIGIEAARRAVVEAEDPVRLAGHRVRADMFVPGQVADLDRVAEGMAEYRLRSEEHTSELQSLMRISYAVFCLKKKKIQNNIYNKNKHN